MSWLAWVALLGPTAAATLGWVTGFGLRRERDAMLIRELLITNEGLRNEIEALEAERDLLAAAPISDDEFDRVLDHLEGQSSG